MKRTYLCATLAVPFLFSQAFSQITYDTVSTRLVGPNIIHTHIVTQAVPWNINVLQIDLTNPYVSLESVKANDRLSGYEQTSSMAARNDYAGHTVVGAVNGDFYGGGGVPIGIQVSKGEILLFPHPTRPALGFDAMYHPMIDPVALSGTVLAANASHAIDTVNGARKTNWLVLYNSYFGSSTGTNSSGTEVGIIPIDSWLANDTLLCLVDTVVSGVGNFLLPKGRGVLSGHGTAQTFLDTSFSQGDTIRLVLSLTPGLARLKEMVGGYPRLISNGVVVIGSGSPREPRTAAGFSADSSTLYLITVDGRQTGFSVGMTFPELADFMKKIGVAHGVNLDGGGSTTMIVRGEIMNSPSDGSERAVSNGMIFVSSAPVGSLADVRISVPRVRLFRGDSFQFHAYGVDQYGNPVAIDPGQVQYTADPAVGSIDASGVLFSATARHTGYVRLSYGSYLDSAYVVIKMIDSLRLAPRNVVTDLIRTIQFGVTSFDEDNIYRPLPTTSYAWRTSEPSVGTISSDGVFTGLSAGMTYVIAEVDGVSDSTLVSVQLGSDSALIDSMESLAGWTYSGLNINLGGTSLASVTEDKTLGDRSFKIVYSFTKMSIKSYVYLDKNVPIFGVPDAIVIDARSDSATHRLYYVVEDNDGEQFRFYTSKYANRVGMFDTVSAPLKTPVPLDPPADFQYPITLKRIEIELGAVGSVIGQSYTGTIFLDNLRVTYPEAVTAVEQLVEVPYGFELSQNYPNPFNPATTIAYRIPVRSRVVLTVFNLLGQKIAVLSDRVLGPGQYTTQWSARVPSGIYFYRLMATPEEDGGEDVVMTRSMVLIK